MNNFIPFRKENQKTILKKLLPETRILIAFIFALPVPFLTNYRIVSIILLSVLVIGVIIRIELREILKRWIRLLPIILVFVVFLPFFNGTIEFWSFYIGQWKIIIYLDRLWFALWLFLVMNTMFFSFMIFFSSLSFTEFSHVRLIPSLFRSTIVLTLRYIPMFFEQNKKISEAQALRGKSQIKGIVNRVRYFGYMLAATLVKSLEQSTKTYESLKLRGFGGSLPVFSKKVSVKDILIIVGCIIYVFLIIYYGQIYFL
ncbi:MAG: energy-coupling factor transporter transmembrane component T family protein [Candidatus Helarchaeota archaeon]